MRAASEHLGIFRAFVTGPGLDDVVGQGRFWAELSEANLLFLGPGHSLLQFGMLWVQECFPMSVCSKAGVVFFAVGVDLCKFLLLVEHV